MIARVVVDVPVAQVDHYFDYLIPETIQPLLRVGMRVKVPFGNRQLLGFVVDLVEDSQYQGSLKEISQLMDYKPFLNSELIRLGHEFANRLQVFEVSMLEAMLPSMLKVKYKTLVRIQKKDLFEEMTGLTSQETYAKDELEDLVSSKDIRQLLDQGIIDIEYQVVDKSSKKYIKVISPLLSFDDYQDIFDSLSDSYRRQQELIAFLMDHVGEEGLPSNKVDVPFSVIRAAEEKGWLKLQEEEVFRSPLKNLHVAPSQRKTLTASQEAAYEPIHASLSAGQAETFLLEGVTGSGKTEVYLQLMEDALNNGQSALLLVPEISLTPQMLERVIGRFGDGVAVLHSGLSASERYDEWRRIVNGQAQIVVGARSSVFAPLNNLGIIIMDEEHETTYKQSDNPRYHARDLAIWRSHYHSCPLLLGSATPSLESRTRAQVGRYHHIVMTDRVNQTPLPPVELVDMSQLMARETLDEFSPRLKQAIGDRLAKREQIILLLNRRGYASYVQCRECGYVFQCPRCDISLTYHKSDHCLKCHYCDHQEAMPQSCPSCGSDHLRNRGMGTQKVAESLKLYFPQARILRMDNDTTRRKGDHERILQTFAKEEADILLGTQMIAKGLDFEKVTLVGVINGDTALNLPDFRAGEKTFQLLTQVSGRTGRGAYPGQVIIQTYNPDHYVMHFAKTHDYESFYFYEMKRRHLASYPPYYFMTLLTVSAKQEGRALQKAYAIKRALQDNIGDKGQDFIILGPSQTNVARIKDAYYFQILLKYKDKTYVQNALNQVLEASQDDARKGIYVSIDNDPLFFL